MADTDFDDDDLEYDEIELSAQMRAQLDRLLANGKSFGPGGRLRRDRQGPIRRRIEDWHEARAFQRGFDYLNERLDRE